ncbi:MAG: fenitrothion hydrolase [Solirubrobacterales bacterium]|nr:fenitrothion hydrolase [Solirubrobacterales bacterium]
MNLGDLFLVGHALVGRQDLPIPAWLFAWGASLVLIVSFVALSLAWHRPRFEEIDWRPAGAWVSRALVNPVTELLAGAIGVFLLGVVIWSGLQGTEAPDRNFSVTFVFITVWLGMVVASVLFGDVFRAFNPWRAIARATGGLFKLIAGQAAPPPLRYPERLGRWPAVAGLLGFVWLELVYGQAGFQAVGLTPHTVAVATLAYTAYTLVAMVLFGSERWLARGEAFSVYFSMFASLSPLEAREGRLGVRGWLRGASAWVGAVPGSVAMILLTIGATTFDGAGEGTLAEAINSLYNSLQDAGLGPIAALRVSNSLFMALTLGFVAALYWAGIYGMHTVRAGESTRRLGTLFAHAFIPIGLAYLVAHYFSIFVFQEQAQFGFLLSDPLGDGSDIFGTAGGGIDYGTIGSEAIWYVQVGALIAGHVTALVLGHDRALRIFGDSRLAARSQYWMLALMVGFTSLGLYLLSQANA